MIIDVRCAHCDGEGYAEGQVCRVCGGSGTEAAEVEVEYYRAGQCRNDENALSHTYAQMSDGSLWPMCGYGWNRSNGDRFSIFRGSPGTEGDCKICSKNVATGKPPALNGFPHKTRWL